MKKKLSALLSLSPLLVFLCVYLVSSLVAGDFYLIPVPAAFLVACVYAVAVSRGSLASRIGTMSRGAGHPKVLLMIWIFILAGAFAGSAKILPPRMKGWIRSTTLMPVSKISVLVVRVSYAGAGW